MKQSKKGFTLIELMVVIVIIGILAAIAIPKLFGMTAKAKAQEVGPAAGTWSKLQQAYIAETGKVGSNPRIGYTLPGATSSTHSTSTTTNFTYGVSMLGTSATAGATVAGTDESTASASWAATNAGGLNDCTPDMHWIATVDVTPDNTQPVLGVIATDDEGDCAQLTPNFDKLK